MRTALLLLAAIWSAWTAAAQPASDLLQSGIYYQETSGDLDSAIRVYRQILSSGPGQRLYAAQAQFRLGECLLLDNAFKYSGDNRRVQLHVGAAAGRVTFAVSDNGIGIAAGSIR